MVNVYVFEITSICIHGEEQLRQITFHQKKIRNILHGKVANNQYSGPRVHPEECSRAKKVENCQYTSALIRDTIETVLRIISVNQLSIYGAVSDLCEELKTCHVGTGRLVLTGRSESLFVPTSVMKTHTPLTDDPAQEEDLLQRCQERVERLSQQDRVIKFCIDAGFLTTVDVGQYFMTNDTEEFLQFTDSVTCREYTLSRDGNSPEAKGWIRGNIKIGPMLEVTTSYLQGKY